MGEAAHALDVAAIVTSLVGGLALFLFGLDQMAGALKAVAGERMKAILARLTRNRVFGVFTGAFVTAVIQSSSVTTVLVVGFVSAGLMTLAQSVGAGGRRRCYAFTMDVTARSSSPPVIGFPPETPDAGLRGAAGPPARSVGAFGAPWSVFVRLVSVAIAVLAMVIGPDPAPARASTAAPDTPDRPGDPLPGAEAGDEAVLWYFWREDCPFCEQAEVWLEQFQGAHDELTVEKVEVIRDPAGRERFVTMMRERGERASAVPTFIFGDDVWVGFSRSIVEQLDARVAAHLDDAAEAPGRSPRSVDLGPFGTLDLTVQPMLVATVLIAFVDGFNPCSLWVLTVLLAMILGTRSRARIAAVGVTFLLVTVSIYGLFIVGLFTALFITGHLGWIQAAIALLAVGFGAVNVKDYFAYKKGLSFTIPDRFKPAIYRGGRTIRKDRPLWLTLAITVGLAAGVAIVELPCTAGFPMIWTSMVSDASVGPGAFAGLLAVYLLVYLSVEIAIVIGAIVTMRISRMQEEHGRVLKLVSGMILIGLGVVLLVDRTLMEHLAGSLIVIGSALAASLLVVLATRWWTGPE